MKNFKLTITIALIFICCSLPFVTEEIKAKGNGLEGYLIFTANPDSTATYYRNAMNTTDWHIYMLYLRIAGFDCDSIFTLKWILFFTGDSTDFQDYRDELYNPLTFGADIDYYPPNDIGNCELLKPRGTITLRNYKGGGSTDHNGLLIFKANSDSTVSYINEATTNDIISFEFLKQKQESISCDSLIFWKWTASFTGDFLQDITPPYSGVTVAIYPDTTYEVDCDSLIIDSPF